MKQAPFNRAAALVAAFLLFGTPAAVRAEEPVLTLNTVGYQKFKVPGQAESGRLRMASVPFNAPVQNLDGLVGTQLVGHIDASMADQVFAFDSLAQQYRYSYLLPGSGVPPEFQNRWFDPASGTLATNDLPPGTGFFFVNNHAPTRYVTVAGDVVTNATITLPVRPGLNLIAYPFNAPVALADLNLGAAPVGHLDPSFADNIVLFNADLQEWRYFYRTPASGLPPQYANKWIDTANAIIATNVLQQGDAFYYVRRGNLFHWSENRPYTPP